MKKRLKKKVYSQKDIQKLLESNKELKRIIARQLNKIKLKTGRTIKVKPKKKVIKGLNVKHLVAKRPKKINKTHFHYDGAYRSKTFNQTFYNFSIKRKYLTDIKEEIRAFVQPRIKKEYIISFKLAIKYGKIEIHNWSKMADIEQWEAVWDLGIKEFMERIQKMFSSPKSRKNTIKLLKHFKFYYCEIRQRRVEKNVKPIEEKKKKYMYRSGHRNKTKRRNDRRDNIRRSRS